MTQIKPDLPGGFKDYLPIEQAQREKVIDLLRWTAFKSGFLPMDTPGIEKKEVLAEGDSEIEKQIFEIDRDDEKQDLALRFDLTVPLARFMAAYPNDIEKPFKRYQYGRAWRGEKPQAGRYREFQQFDIDIVGAPGMLADAEIIAFIADVLDALRISDGLIRLNNRKILDQLPVIAGFDPTLLSSVLRAIDKLEKIGWSGVEDELSDVGLNEKQAKTVKEFIELSAENSQTLLASVEKIITDADADLEGVREMEQIVDYLYAFDVPESLWDIDLSIARGLDYYTGPIFETIIKDSDVGSIFSGGRYDSLMERFSGSPMPAVGASLGVDRLLTILEEFKDNSLSNVLVLNFDNYATGYCVRFLTELRSENISSEIYLGQEDSLKGQLSYGVKRNFPVVVIAGSDEKDSETLQIKDIKNEKQYEVPLKEGIEKVREIIENV